jgi:hypothetical protein
MAELAGNLWRHGIHGTISRRIWPPNAPSELGDISVPLEKLSVKKFTTGVVYNPPGAFVHQFGPVLPMKENLYDLLKSDIDKCSFGLYGRQNVNADLGIAKDPIHRIEEDGRVSYLTYAVIIQEQTYIWAHKEAKPLTGNIWDSTLGYIYVSRVGRGEDAVDYLKFKRIMRMDTELYPPPPAPRFSEFKFHLTKYTYTYLHNCLRNTLLKAFEPFAEKEAAAKKFLENKGLPANVANLISGKFKYGTKRKQNVRVPLNKLAKGKEWNFNPAPKNPSMARVFAEENTAAAAARHTERAKRAKPANENGNGNGNRSGGGKTRKRRTRSKN